jgi:hypothetical protein
MSEQAQGPASPEGRHWPGQRILAVVIAFSLAACQGLPPAMTTALVGFGQDVLAAAAHNFAPQYATSMQNLFFAMAETATGAPFTQQAYAGHGQAQGAYDQDGYAHGVYDEGYHHGGYDQDDPYQGGYDQEGYAHGEYHAGAYDEGAYTQGVQQPPGYAHAQGAQQPPGYAQGGHSYSPPPQPPVQQAYQAPVASPGIALEVALLAQQRTPDGHVRLRPLSDGEVLYDGRGDPARGDKIKIFFSANCACYVYVIGIDASGYVAQVFPEGDIRSPRRVMPGGRYLLPEGSSWWGLDETRGIEHIYFIASRERRPDIEDLVAELAGRRPALPADYRPVREPAIVAMTRGLVQVQSAAPTVLPTEYGATQEFSPTVFQATVADADLVITRWFRHE